MATESTVKMADGTEFTVAIKVGDTLAWERHAKTNDLDVLSPLAMACFQAYNAARREQKIDPALPFDAFVDALDGLPETTTADPTKKGRGRASSSK